MVRGLAKTVPVDAGKTTEKTRSYLSQEDIPCYELGEDLLVAMALFQQYGGQL